MEVYSSEENKKNDQFLICKKHCEFIGTINGDNISQFLSLSYIMLLLPNIKTSCKQITADNFKTIFKNICTGIELT